MSHTKYITKSGDRWDTVAYKAYGDPMKIGPIAEANPFVPKTAVLPEGITLYVPVLERESVSPSILPPWKQ